MTAPSPLTETAMANGALAEIGETAITDIDDPKRAAARVCKQNFGAVRDALLRRVPWQFAQHRVSPAAVAAPAGSPWAYRYRMPGDCIAPQDIVGADPASWEVSSAGDDQSLGVVVDANITAPQIVYTRRIVNPAQWDALFAQVFQLMLAAKINPLIGRDKQKTNDCLLRAERLLGTASRLDAQAQAANRVSGNTSWIAARRGWRGA